jgi:hypothetical protein
LGPLLLNWLRHEVVGYLLQGEVNLVTDLTGIVGIQPPLFHMPHPADDLDRPQYDEADLPADRVLIRKESQRLPRKLPGTAENRRGPAAAVWKETGVLEVRALMV